MFEVVGISTKWERRMRAIKRGVIKAMGFTPEFTGVIVSNDIAEEIQQSTKLIGSVGDNTTFEGTPLGVDHELPEDSVVYVWEVKDVVWEVKDV